MHAHMHVHAHTHMHTHAACLKVPFQTYEDKKLLNKWTFDLSLMLQLNTQAAIFQLTQIHNRKIKNLHYCFQPTVTLKGHHNWYKQVKFMSGYCAVSSNNNKVYFSSANP